MKHPTSDEIIEFWREELSPRRRQRVENHLENCEECRREYESLTAAGEWLSTWPDRPVAEDSIEKVKRSLEVLGSPRLEHPAVNGSSARTDHRWLRRAAMAAAVVLATMAFQALVWTPLRPTVNLGTVLSLTTPAYAQTAGGAVPDTVLVLTVHTTTTFSTDLLEGEYGMEELIARLKDLVRSGEYREILLTGLEGEDPVSINLSDLDPLREELGIGEIHVGSGVVGVASFWERNMAFFNSQIWSARPRSGDIWPVSPPANWSLFLRGEKDDEGHWLITGERSEEGEEGSSQAAWNYAFAHQGGDSTAAFWTVAPHLVWLPGGERDLFTGRSESHLIWSTLVESDDLTAAVTDEGEVVVSRSLLDLHEVEESLRRLMARSPVETLTILVEDEDAPGPRALELERIARRVGIGEVVFRER